MDNFSSEKNSRMLGIKSRAAGREASVLPQRCAATHLARVYWLIFPGLFLSSFSPCPSLSSVSPWGRAIIGWVANWGPEERYLVSIRKKDFESKLKTNSFSLGQRQPPSFLQSFKTQTDLDKPSLMSATLQGSKFNFCRSLISPKSRILCYCGSVMISMTSVKFWTKLTNYSRWPIVQPHKVEGPPLIFYNSF